MVKSPTLFSTDRTFVGTSEARPAITLAWPRPKRERNAPSARRLGHAAQLLAPARPVGTLASRTSIIDPQAQPCAAHLYFTLLPSI